MDPVSNSISKLQSHIDIFNLAEISANRIAIKLSSIFLSVELEMYGLPNLFDGL